MHSSKLKCIYCVSMWGYVTHAKTCIINIFTTAIIINCAATGNSRECVYICSYRGVVGGLENWFI